MLTQGQRLDIAGILLGTWPDGNTVTVAADGATTAADSRPRHGPHPADVGRLTVLDAAQAADLLRTAIEADTGQAQPTTPGPARELAAADGRPDLTLPRTEPDTGGRRARRTGPSGAGRRRRQPADDTAKRWSGGAATKRRGPRSLRRDDATRTDKRRSAPARADPGPRRPTPDRRAATRQQRQATTSGQIPRDSRLPDGPPTRRHRGSPLRRGPPRSEGQHRRSDAQHLRLQPAPQPPRGRRPRRLPATT